VGAPRVRAHARDGRDPLACEPRLIELPCAGRAHRERIAPARYLASSYYEIWLEGLCTVMLERGLVTPEELRDGRLREPPAALPARLAAGHVEATLARGSPSTRAPAAAPRFAPGDVVRARNIHPLTHTRLPRYCRGKSGTVTRVHGVHAFADALAAGRDDAQWLYAVRFDAHALFGSDTTADAVHVDCWDSYLEPDRA
jgi:nitrile hydratase subunit beta